MRAALHFEKSIGVIVFTRGHRTLVEHCVNTCNLLPTSSFLGWRKMVDRRGMKLTKTNFIFDKLY